MLTTQFHATISPLIQASLSPIFLLTAIGTTLALVDTRQNRIVDRIRAIEAQMLTHSLSGAEGEEELDFYLMRARRIGWAATLCMVASLCVAAVVVILFIDAQTEVVLALLVEIVFALAVSLYVSALLFYLRDVLDVNRGLGYVSQRAIQRGAAKKGHSSVGGNQKSRTP